MNFILELLRREQGRQQKELEFSQLPYQQRVAQLKEQKLPLFFYKYHSLHSHNPNKPQEKWEHASDYLINSRFYLSRPANFNDPFDMRAYFTDSVPKEKKRYFLDQLLKIRTPQLTEKDRVLEVKKLLDNPEKLRTIHKLTLDEAVDSFGVSCLSTAPCNILMWSHYANHHRGIAFQFNFAIDIFSFKWLQPVSYSNDFPGIEYFERRDNKYSIALLTKHHGWEYEKEWRIVKPNGAGTYQDFNSKILTGVILGCRIDRKDEDKIRTMIEQRKEQGLSSVKLYKLRQHESRYKLVIKHVE